MTSPRFTFTIAAPAGLALAAGAALALCGFAADAPRKAPEADKAPGFHTVAFHGLGRVEVKQTGKEAVSVRDGDKLVADRGHKVKDGVLILGAKPQPGRGARPVEYVVEVKALKGLRLLGAGSIEAADLKGERLAVSLGGTGSVTVKGTADALDVTHSGAGALHGEGLRAKRVTVNLSGVGNAEVHATQSLDVSLTGVGSVLYVGSPAVRQNIVGVGTVRKKR
jgi:hypothetical protein